MPQESANGDAPLDPADARLFDQFDAPSFETWREATVTSLNGLPFEKLITRTYEGIDLQPLYRAEDVADLSHVNTLPGRPPFVRGADAAGYLQQPWAIAQEISAPTPAEFNRQLLHDLNRGQDAINLGIDADGHRGVPVEDAAAMAEALASVDLTAVPIILRAGVDALPAAALLLVSRASAGNALRGAVVNDPLGELASAGALPAVLDALYDEMAALTLWAETHAPALHTISVQAERYQDAGADAVTELAVALATGVAYLRAMLVRGLTIDAAAARMTFGFGLGSNFFMEVAKLRAARLLWSQAVAAFGGSADAQRMTIHGRTAEWNKTIYDPYVNMLRVTTEAFAGAIGGVQSMHVTPFDGPLRPADEFSRRIARNTQLILQDECNLTRLIDPSGGSWYVEALTDELAQAAWQRFQAIEAAGGMAAVLGNGSLQDQIAETAQARVANLNRRKDVLVGTNMYPNLREERLPVATVSAVDDAPGTSATPARDVIAVESDPAVVDAAIQAAADGATLAELRAMLRDGAAAGPIVPALTPLRVAASFEALRAAAEAYAESTGAPPRVFLATMGPLAQHKARADFSQGFVNVGGFVCDYPPGFAGPEEAADAALASGAQAVVICSTDDTYPEIVPAFAARIKAVQPGLPVLVAGYPKDHVDAFRAAGVDEFIHLRADCYALNAWLQEQAGL